MSIDNVQTPSVFRIGILQPARLTVLSSTSSSGDPTVKPMFVPSETMLISPAEACRSRNTRQGYCERPPLYLQTINSVSKNFQLNGIC